MRRKKTPLGAVTVTQPPLQLAGGQGKDLSGRDFHKTSIQGQNFFESIFNGCSFDELRACQSIFQHAEFTETRLSNCVFEDTSFDHSDFVLADINDSEFIRCSFQNAEWRDTLFERVRFRQCIFRNTTTSLTRFVDCEFDDASASNFIGPSKRFSVFSGTTFHLTDDHVAFLQTNFGLTSQVSSPLMTVASDDAFFELSLLRYRGQLTSTHLYDLLLRALSGIIAGTPAPQRLRMRYLCEICKVCLDEQVLSVFGIQLLERALSRSMSAVRDRDHAIELLSLVLTVRASLREQITSIEQRFAGVPRVLASDLGLRIEFEQSYERSSISEYLLQLAAYCDIPSEDVILKRLQSGSTIADVLLAGSMYVVDIVRFITYSLSLATVTVKEAGKLRKEYSRLAKPSTTKTKLGKLVSPPNSASKRHRPQPSPENVAKEIIGVKLENANPIEVFVDAMNERVLVVDGRVRVTITLTGR